MSMHVQPPPERFNFAAHLLAVNAGRPDKDAFVDERETLSYGALPCHTSDYR